MNKIESSVGNGSGGNLENNISTISLETLSRVNTEVEVGDAIDVDWAEKTRWAVYKKINIAVPPDLSAYFDRVSLQVIELINQTQVVEFHSDQPGPLVFYTGGMHGEEAKLHFMIGSNKVKVPMAVDEIVTALGNNLTSLNKGSVIAIPRLNKPGYENGTRYVFPDEDESNLNREFHHFEKGDWKEFFSLKTKTAKLAWLIMKYLVTKADEYKRQYGNHNIYLIDDHREECVPFLRIDRMDERKELLEKMINAYLSLGLPITLEGLNWRKEDMHQAISAVGAEQGWMTATVEEGNTVRPDKHHGYYISRQVILWLRDKGMITVDKKWVENPYIDKVLLGGRDNPLRRARRFWREQAATGQILRLEEIEPERFFRPFFKYRTFLENGLTLSNWDGIVTFCFDSRMRGMRFDLHEKAVYGDFAFGEHSSTKYHSRLSVRHGNLWLESMSDEFYIIDIPEPRVPEWTTFCCYGYFYEDAKKESVSLRPINGRKYNRNNIIPIEELRSIQGRIKLEEKVFDEVSIAIPDSKWRGNIVDGKVKLSPIN